VGKSEKAEKQRSTAGKDKRPVGRIRNLPSPLSPWRPSRLGGKSSSPHPKSKINNQQSTIINQQSSINNHQSLPPFALRLSALPSPLPQSSAAGAIKISLRDCSP
jgi:hypothetical protein